MKTHKLYSPRQAYTAAFLGGPFALIHVIRSNYVELDNKAASRVALYWGAVFVIALLIVLPFLPEKFPNSAIPIGYSVAAGQLVEKYQLSKDAIRQSGQYDFQTIWRVIGVGIVSLILFLPLAAVWIFLLKYIFGFSMGK